MKRALLALAVVALLAGRARADRDYVQYKVRAGDTLSLLAAEYYGDRDHALFIMVANKMQHPRPLKPGEKLRIPVTREVTAAVGDNFDGLAQTYLGDKRRAYEEGLRIPFLVRYPKLVKAGSKPTAMALNIDVAPTLLELVDVPAGAGMTGRSLIVGDEV